jgi:hypothetical protein
MTIKEALNIKLKKQKLILTDEELALVLEESKLIGTADYDYDLNGKGVDLAFAGLLLETVRVTEVREDDVSIKYSNDLKTLISWLYTKWGLPDPFAVVVPKPIVKQVNFW